MGASIEQLQKSQQRGTKMKLYIANGTQQKHTFAYRLPNSNKVLTQPIAIGSQICIPRDLQQPEVDAVVKQHQKYGMIPAREIGSRGSPNSPMAFQVDKAFNPEQIAQLMAVNRGEMIKIGEQIRRDTAVVIATELGRAGREQPEGEELLEVQIDVIEEKNRSGNTSPENVFEQIIATPEGRQPRRNRRDRS